MIGHNASGFVGYFVLNSLLSSYKCIKMFKTSRALIKLRFKAGSMINVDKKTPKMKVVCPKCHISGSLKNIQKEYNFQPDLIKGEINHASIILVIISIMKTYGDQIP